MGGYLLQSNFGSRGDFEVVVPVNGELLLYFHHSNDAENFDTPWEQGNQGKPIVGNVNSMPALIQSNLGSNLGSKGNFEVVVPHRSGLQYWRRNNDAFETAWEQGNQGNIITSQVIGSPALIQSNLGNQYGAKGNFEVLLRTAPQSQEFGQGELRHWWHDNDAGNFNTAWAQGNQGKPIVTNVTGSPALIQSNFGHKGNFEVVVPVRGRLIHLWRDNDADDYNTAWASGNQENAIVTNVTGSPALIQSSFGSRGDFEVVVPVNGELLYFRRNNDAENVDTAWAQGNQGKPIVTNVTGSPALIQSSFGSRGDFEVVVPVNGELLYFRRSNDAGNVDTPWEQGNQGKPIVGNVIDIDQV